MGRGGKEASLEVSHYFPKMTFSSFSQFEGVWDPAEEVAAHHRQAAEAWPREGGGHLEDLGEPLLQPHRFAILAGHWGCDSCCRQPALLDRWDVQDFVLVKPAGVVLSSLALYSSGLDHEQQHQHQPQQQQLQQQQPAQQHQQPQLLQHQQFFSSTSTFPSAVAGPAYTTNNLVTPSSGRASGCPAAPGATNYVPNPTSVATSASSRLESESILAELGGLGEERYWNCWSFSTSCCFSDRWRRTGTSMWLGRTSTQCAPQPHPLVLFASRPSPLMNLSGNDQA